MTDTLLETKEVAERLSLSVRRIRTLLKAKQLRHMKVRGRYLVPETAIQEFVENFTVASDIGTATLPVLIQGTETGG